MKGVARRPDPRPRGETPRRGTRTRRGGRGSPRRVPFLPAREERRDEPRLGAFGGPGSPRRGASLRRAARPRAPAAAAGTARSGFSTSAPAEASPRFPLLIVRADLEGTLVESSRKKAAYLDETLSRLALTARAVNARFPDSFPMDGAQRHDVLTTRAVGSAGRLVRAARPLLAPGARALLWTTRPLADEAARASRAKKHTFHPAPGADLRGILALECFT